MRIDTRKIRMELAKRRMTQSTLAELSGISRQSISTIIARGTCSPANAGKIASGLKIDLVEITKER